MKLLLDTCTFLWMVGKPEALSARARAVLGDATNVLHLSAVSSFEIAVKAALGKLTLMESPEALVPRQMLRNGIVPLCLDHVHALKVHALPMHHADPFDRLLVAQAQVERLTVVTPDPAFAAYGVSVLW
ncbi:MAG: type II toxin-antitoxin system VapC family toxin [Deltaproteobacteria bacterium]|nr:type II toxin-antitoxin system VapC family toxin [Deltaproteobacteria bacterium]